MFMNSSIYFFSGTGNSLFVAKNLASKLDAQCFNIARILKEKEVNLDADILGFVFPVYAYTYPKVLDAFIKKARVLSKPKYVFIIVTYGSTPGRAAHKFAKRLKKLFRADYINGVLMPENYVPIFKPDSPEVIQSKLNAAFEKIQKLCDDIESNVNYIERRNTPLDFVKSNLVGPVFNMFLPFSHSFFRVNKDCNGCEICVKICPVNNIKKKNNKPKWNNKCVQCMACLNWCPQKSINYTPLTKKRSRYVNPCVKINELFEE